MNAILTWFAGARWRMSLSHIPEAVPIQLVIAAIAHSYWFGSLGVVVWYWSRKKLEAELASKTTPDESDAYTWATGWFPWDWDIYMVLDIVFPALSSLLIAALAQHLNLTQYLP
jgi:hypothetical protein